MRFRNSRLRIKITALLLSLVALWGFAAWVTVREGVNLLWVQTLSSGVAAPVNTLVPELQAERRLSAEQLGSGQHTAVLVSQRATTDQARTKLRRLAQSGDVGTAASSTLKHRLSDAFRKLDSLDALRRQIDSGALDRRQAAAGYTDVLDSVFRIYDSLATLDDASFAAYVRTLTSLYRSREVLSQEDALLAGALAAKHISPSDRIEFTQLVGARRYLLAQLMPTLQESDSVTAAKVSSSGSLALLVRIEDAAAQPGKGNGSLPPSVDSTQWEAATKPALADLRQIVLDAGNRAVKKATPIAIGVVIRLVLAGGLGLLAVIASIVLSITTARQLARRLEELRMAAYDLAVKRLPGVVERLGQGERVDVTEEAPPLKLGEDAIGQVAKAFNTVQETAIRTAVEQAELRRGIRDILLSLARRSQALVHRQLTLLDTMERREQDVTELEDLFRVDHLATRMRRNAENLIVLSGATPARGWRRPVPMMDVVRSAVAEVEDYTRVRVVPIGDVALTGRAVGDISHLLAELIENAVSFSPPYTEAVISGHMAASGFAIEIEDRGLGMTDEALAAINERISDPPEFNLSSSVQLGLYVVGRLAERYGLKVSLKHSPYGGTTAVVLVPRDLIVEGQEPAEDNDGVAVKVGVTAEVEAVVAHPRPALVPAPAPDTASDTASDTAEVEVSDEPDEAQAFTLSGLPFRVPQASLVPALREEPAAVQADENDEDEVRSPEEIRKIVGAFQTGTRRGRSDAARVRGRDDDDQKDG